MRSFRALRCRGAHVQAHHTGGSEARPDQYEQRVIGFFDHALLGEE
jgi:hypothetical protein